MRLDELLEMKYETKGKTKRACIQDVYGIIYRIYCIPENKSYVGQTFSHHYSSSYFIRTGILKRVKHHWSDKDREESKDRPLYKAFCTYPPDQFEIYEEKKIYGKDLANIHQFEEEYMKKYDCLEGNGYNFEEIARSCGKLIDMLAEHHGFEIKKTDYYDEKTRSKRCKDVCIGVYFNIPRSEITPEKNFERLSKIDIESIRIVDSKGFRIIIKPRDENVNIRLYFRGSKEDCVKYAKSLSDNVEIAPSFIGKDCYKYQDKIDKIIDNAQIIELVKGSIVSRNNDLETYLLIFYGTKNNKRQSIIRISFGGKNISISDSYDTAMKFLEKLSSYETMSHLKIDLNQS